MDGKVVGEKERITVLSIPLDVVGDGELEDRIADMLADGSRHQIVLLGLWDFMRARGKGRFAQSVRNASLVVPTSKLVVWGANFLRGRKLGRHMPFEFVIRVLTFLEQRNKSLYLIGARPEVLQKAAANLRGSFPGLHIVGRCAGYFHRSNESNILLAIKKAAPAIVLAGKGVPDGEHWLFMHRGDLAPGLGLWGGDCIEVFSGRKRKTPRELWKNGLDFLPEVLGHPWRLLRGFAYLWYFLLLLVHRLRKL